MIATSIEQSQHLLRLGLDPSTADMCYEPYMSEDGDIDITDLTLCLTPYMLNSRISFPAWSLSALLEVMKEHCPELLFLEAYWYCLCMQVESEYCDDPITAAYDVVCWLLNHGAIKK